MSQSLFLILSSVVFVRHSKANCETSYGYRGPEPPIGGGKEALNTIKDCTFGRLCVGPSSATNLLDTGHGHTRGRRTKTTTTLQHKMYPVYPGTTFQSVFEVPPLPEYFDTESMTYYDYFNIYFDGAYQPKGAKFNQFVPQLMLGNALAKSTGPPTYDPIWVQLDSWHFGAQYFMGIYKREEIHVVDAAPNTFTYHDTNKDAEHYEATSEKPWIPKAAVGSLHSVYPGELLETKITLSNDGMVWKLEMKVLGDTKRVSTLLVDKPFMGLLDDNDDDELGTTKQESSSWKQYEATTIGSCWENYGMVNETSYPPFWHQVHTIRYPKNVPPDDEIWGEWTVDNPTGGNCSKAPTSTIRSFVVSETSTQIAVWDIEQNYSD